MRFYPEPMRKFFICALIAAVIFNARISFASAHVLNKQGPIGVVLHISPNDHLVAGQEAEFILEFKDKEDNFTMDECDCQASISKNGQQLFSIQLANGRFRYTFPESTAYKLAITGEPKQPEQFAAFDLNYDLHVDSTASPTGEHPQNHTPHIIIFGGGLLVIAGLYVKNKRQARKNKTDQTLV